jgi:signal transduction histidine kinase
MNTVIEDVYALTATYMRHKNIVFEFLQDGTEAVIPGIPDQMRQVLLNLFMNAIDAMPNGGKITVSTQSLPEQEKIYLTVLDSGPGIASAILPNIFEPFTTDKDTGTGLGMTIVRDIILQHSGEIQAENYAEGGALFKIWLPSVKKE